MDVCAIGLIGLLVGLAVVGEVPWWYAVAYALYVNRYTVQFTLPWMKKEFAEAEARLMERLLSRVEPEDNAKDPKTWN